MVHRFRYTKIHNNIFTPPHSDPPTPGLIDYLQTIYMAEVDLHELSECEVRYPSRLQNNVGDRSFVHSFLKFEMTCWSMGWRVEFCLAAESRS